MANQGGNKSGPKASPAIITRQSTCLCGSVKLEVTGEDKRTVLCHCSNCKHASGSAFAFNHRFTKAKVNVIEGEHVLRQYADDNTKTGSTVYRHFCSKCGSPLWLSNSAFAGFVALSVGNLQGDKKQPFMELFADEKCGWIGEVVDKSKL